MEIKTVDLDSLAFDENNARHHGERNLEAIRGSLATFGQVEPLVVQAKTGRVIGGNGRLAVLKNNGAATVEVVEVDLDDQQASALGLALNRTAELAEWDVPNLELLTHGLEDFDLAGIGFAPDELQTLLDAPADEPPAEPREDFPEDDALPDNIPAVTKPGEAVTIGNQRLICGDCIAEMAKLEPNSIDAVVTDPPYGIGFMGKGWDCAVPGEDFAREAFRVLKPGGHLIAFAATRTAHRLTVALEDSGFEIRDQIGWLQWQGFPKSLDVSKAIDNAAGAVREIVELKSGPVPGTHGGSGKYGHGTDRSTTTPATPNAKTWEGWGTALKPSQEPAVLCRKPLEGTVAENVLKWGTGAINIDGCRIAYGDPAWPGPGGEWEETTRGAPVNTPLGSNSGAISVPSDLGRWPANIYHCPKPSRGERDQHNHHPTVKPINLMRWLVRLVTPPGGVLLEPFAGSGTTLLAAEREGFKSIGIEQQPEYCDIIRARLTATDGNP